jgi:hypothetical protein
MALFKVVNYCARAGVSFMSVLISEKCIIMFPRIPSLRTIPICNLYILQQWIYFDISNKHCISLFVIDPCESCCYFICRFKLLFWTMVFVVDVFIMFSVVLKCMLNMHFWLLSWILLSLNVKLVFKFDH